jgi:hypothetical protein
MNIRLPWLWALGVALLLSALPLSLARAGEPGTKQLPSPEGKEHGGTTARFVGTILMVLPETQTLVVDVPISADILRVRARITEQTRIERDGSPATIESLQSGVRVRLLFRRLGAGNEAIAVEILGRAKS